MKPVKICIIQTAKASEREIKPDYMKNQSANINVTDKNIFNCKINILLIV